MKPKTMKILDDSARGLIIFSGVALGIAYLHYFTSNKLVEEKSLIRYKVGFEQKVTLKDGREVTYAIRDFGDLSEHVWINGIAGLSDSNNDRKVDMIFLPEYSATISVGALGGLHYDKSRFNEKQARDIVATANSVYSEAVSLVDKKKFDKYSSGVPGNPLEVSVKAESEK